MTDAVASDAQIDAITKTLALSASPERVWRALTDPGELAAWFPERVDDLEASERGEGWLFWEECGRYAVCVEVLEPPTRLVWRWARDPETPIEDGHTTTVEWKLEARDDGGTTLHLAESGFASVDDRSANVDGWEHELSELIEFLAV